jgi:hypothetical protein
MRALRPLLLVVSLASALGPLACATTTSSTTTAPARQARDFHALAVGNRWLYRATPGPPEPRALTVVGFEGGYFVFDRGGRLAPRTDGLFDGERCLLQDPVVVGHQWIAKRADQGLERYRIDADDVAVTVPAGTFSGCVQATGLQQVTDEATGRPATLRVTTTWAPGIGAVRVAFSVQLGDAPPVTTSVSELVAFEPATQGAASASPSSPPSSAASSAASPPSPTAAP